MASSGGQLLTGIMERLHLLNGPTGQVALYLQGPHSSCKNGGVHTAGQGGRPWQWWNFNSGGISSYFIKLCKITVQWELKPLFSSTAFAFGKRTAMDRVPLAVTISASTHILSHECWTHFTQNHHRIWRLLCPDKLVCVQHTSSAVLSCETTYKSQSSAFSLLIFLTHSIVCRPTNKNRSVRSLVGN